MLNVLRTSLRTPRRTIAYPAEREVAPTALRGRPALDPARCDCNGACAEVCPSGAITLTEVGDGARRWQLDLARCLFCGLCAEVCPTGALAMSNDFELAARSRDELISGVTFGASSPVAIEEAGAEAVSSVAALGEALGERIGRLLRRSLHIRHCDAGSENACDWELNALLNPVYDLQRFGIDFVASPRHADLLTVSGAVTRNLEPALRAAYEAMPAPRLVVAVGDEACSGGILQGSYAVAGGVDRVIPVDVYIPGDPPRPQALIQGLLMATGRLEPRRIPRVGEAAGIGRHR
jgi:Ni,Fe-hydrogenase III small subunit/formate hydrogenlyase subunit 6/NADH:ubiquinone oxidoreductase subunit I